MNFEIRLALPEDVELLTEMRLEMRRERETVPLSMPETEFRRLTRESFTRLLNNGTLVSFLAFAGPEAAACSGMLLQESLPSYRNPSGKTGFILNMYTRPDWRGNHLAVRLLDALRDHARNLGCARLELSASPMGRGVYLKYGFSEISGQMRLELK